MSSAKRIPVGVTNRHIHISQAHLDQLFGSGHRLQNRRPITQKGQFAAVETVRVEGPKGVLESVRIVGPPRLRTQVEVAPSDARVLGLSPPVRYSGDLEGSPGARLVGPRGSVDLPEGVIIPQRHIHADPATAAAFGIQDGNRVYVGPVDSAPAANRSESRAVIFTNVLVRVDPSFVLDFHIDVDEANACGLQTGDQVRILGGTLEAPGVNEGWITERDVWNAILKKKKIRLRRHSRVTPAAWDLGRAHRIFEETS